MTTTFTGRTRAETKRKALAYWVDNRESLGMSMRDFFERCSISADGTSIVFHPISRVPGRFSFLRLRRNAG
jgi:hypothetical protein